MTDAASPDPQTADNEERVDLVIIGAGPAGTAAIETLAPYGLSIIVVDEQPRPGGQIYRQPPEGFAVKNWLKGGLYREGLARLSAVSRMPEVRWRFSTTALGLFESEDGAHRRLWVSGPEGTATICARAVLLAPGCYEMPTPFPGWDLPGVMGAGGVQAFVKSQQFVPGERFVFAGAHPLQLIVADQVRAAGGRVEAVVFAQSAWRALSAARDPLTVLRHTPKFMEAAKAFIRLRAAGVKMMFESVIVAAEGEGAVEGARVSPSGSAHGAGARAHKSLPCDVLALCYGFLPSSELARQAGARVDWDRQGGGWVVNHDAYMRSTVDGLYVAGEITGVAGAEVAAEEGRLAALGVLADLERLAPNEAAAKRRPVMRKLRTLNAFARLLRRMSAPPEGVIERLADADTIICRCELVSRGGLERLLEEAPHINTADGAKLACRVGMGLCQGRYCSQTVTRLIAAARGIDETEAGGFAARAPVKPVLLSDIVGADTLID